MSVSKGRHICMPEPTPPPPLHEMCTHHVVTILKVSRGFDKYLRSYTI